MRRRYTSSARSSIAADVGAIHLDASARRPIDAAEQIEQCRLAAAARPHDGDGLAVFHLPVDALQRLDVFSRRLVNLADLRDGDIHAARREKRASTRLRLPDPLAAVRRYTHQLKPDCDADEQHDEHDTDDGRRPRRPETRRQQLYDRADLTQFPDVIREPKSAEKSGHTAHDQAERCGREQRAQEKPPHIAGPHAADAQQGQRAFVLGVVRQRNRENGNHREQQSAEQVNAEIRERERDEHVGADLGDLGGQVVHLERLDGERRHDRLLLRRRSRRPRCSTPAR